MADLEVAVAIPISADNLDTVAGGFETLQATLDAIENYGARISASFNAIDSSSISDLSTRADGAVSSLDALYARITTVNSGVSELNDNLRQLEDGKSGLASVGQAATSTVIQIAGVSTQVQSLNTDLSNLGDGTVIINNIGAAFDDVTQKLSATGGGGIGTIAADADAATQALMPIATNADAVTQALNATGTSGTQALSNVDDKAAEAVSALISLAEQTIITATNFDDIGDGANRLDEVGTAAAGANTNIQPLRSQPIVPRESKGEIEAIALNLGMLSGKLREVGGIALPFFNAALAEGTELFKNLRESQEPEINTLGMIGGGIAGVGLAIAAVSFESFDHGVQSLERLSLMSGMTTAEVSGLQTALVAAGGGAESAQRVIALFQRNLETMQQTLDKGEAPTGHFADALKTLGVEAAGADGKVKPMQELLPDIMDKFKEASDRAKETGERFNATGVAGELFGSKLGVQLVPALLKGSEAFKEFSAAAEKGGIGSEEQIVALEKWDHASAALQQQTQILAASLGSNAAPAMSAMAAGASNLVGVLNELPKPAQELVLLLPLVVGGAAAVAGIASNVAGKFIEMGTQTATVTTALRAKMAAEAASIPVTDMRAGADAIATTAELADAAAQKAAIISLTGWTEAEYAAAAGIATTTTVVEAETLSIEAMAGPIGLIIGALTLLGGGLLVANGMMNNNAEEEKKASEETQKHVTALTAELNALVAVANVPYVQKLGELNAAVEEQANKLKLLTAARDSEAEKDKERNAARWSIGPLELPGDPAKTKEHREATEAVTAQQAAYDAANDVLGKFMQSHADEAKATEAENIAYQKLMATINLVGGAQAANAEATDKVTSAYKASLASSDTAIAFQERYKRAVEDSTLSDVEFKKVVDDLNKVISNPLTPPTDKAAATSMLDMIQAVRQLKQSGTDLVIQHEHDMSLYIQANRTATDSWRGLEDVIKKEGATEQGRLQLAEQLGQAQRIMGAGAEDQAMFIAQLEEHVRTSTGSVQENYKAVLELVTNWQRFGQTAIDDAISVDRAKTSLSDMGAEFAKDSGPMGDMDKALKDIAGHLNDVGDGARLAGQELLGMLSKPAQAELELKAAIAGTNATIAEQKATIAGTSQFDQHLAGMQHTLDEAIKYGASNAVITAQQKAIDEELARSKDRSTSDQVISIQKLIDKETDANAVNTARLQAMAATREAQQANIRANDGEGTSVQKMADLTNQALDAMAKRHKDVYDPALTHTTGLLDAMHTAVSGAYGAIDKAAAGTGVGGTGTVTPEQAINQQHVNVAGMPTAGVGAYLTADQLAQGLKAAGMDPALITTQVAILLAEHGQVGVANWMGATGIGQIMPATGAMVGLDVSSVTGPGGATPEGLAAQFKAIRDIQKIQGFGAWDVYKAWYPGSGHAGPVDAGTGEIMAGLGHGEFEARMPEAQTAVARMNAGGTAPSATTTAAPSAAMTIAQAYAIVRGLTSKQRQDYLDAHPLPEMGEEVSSQDRIAAAEAQTIAMAKALGPPPAAPAAAATTTTTTVTTTTGTTAASAPGAGALPNTGQEPTPAPDKTPLTDAELLAAREKAKADRIAATQEEANEVIQIGETTTGVLVGQLGTVTASVRANDQARADSERGAATAALQETQKAHAALLPDLQAMADAQTSLEYQTAQKQYDIDKAHYDSLKAISDQYYAGWRADQQKATDENKAFLTQQFNDFQANIAAQQQLRQDAVTTEALNAGVTAGGPGTVSRQSQTVDNMLLEQARTRAQQDQARATAADSAVAAQRAALAEADSREAGPDVLAALNTELERLSRNATNFHSIASVSFGEFNRLLGVARNDVSSLASQTQQLGQFTTQAYQQGATAAQNAAVSTHNALSAQAEADVQAQFDAQARIAANRADTVRQMAGLTLDAAGDVARAQLQLVLNEDDAELAAAQKKIDAIVKEYQRATAAASAVPAAAAPAASGGGGGGGGQAGAQLYGGDAWAWATSVAMSIAANMGSVASSPHVSQGGTGYFDAAGHPTGTGPIPETSASLQAANAFNALHPAVKATTAAVQAHTPTITANTTAVQQHTTAATEGTAAAVAATEATSALNTEGRAAADSLSTLAASAARAAADIGAAADAAAAAASGAAAAGSQQTAAQAAAAAAANAQQNSGTGNTAGGGGIGGGGSTPGGGGAGNSRTAAADTGSDHPVSVQVIIGQHTVNAVVNSAISGGAATRVGSTR